MKSAVLTSRNFCKYGILTGYYYTINCRLSTPLIRPSSYRPIYLKTKIIFDYKPFPI